MFTKLKSGKAKFDLKALNHVKLQQDLLTKAC
jgi:hypothetical protein